LQFAGTGWRRKREVREASFKKEQASFGSAQGNPLGDVVQKKSLEVRGWRKGKTTFINETRRSKKSQYGREVKIKKEKRRLAEKEKREIKRMLLCGA